MSQYLANVCNPLRVLGPCGGVYQRVTRAEIAEPFPERLVYRQEWVVGQHVARSYTTCTTEFGIAAMTASTTIVDDNSFMQR